MVKDDGCVDDSLAYLGVSPMGLGSMLLGGKATSPDLVVTVTATKPAADSKARLRQAKTKQPGPIVRRVAPAVPLRIVHGFEVATASR